MDKGILIIIMGHPFYGRFAYNLMLSIKATSKLPICLAYCGSAKNHIANLEPLHDIEVEIPQSYYTDKNGQVNYIQAKLYINKLTPFKETIFLDADMILTPKKSIDDIKFNHDIQFQIRGIQDISQNSKHYWSDLNEVKDVYGIEQYKNIFSEFVYFKSTKEVNKIFTQAQKIAKNIKVKHRYFNGGIPDELPFSIALKDTEMDSFFVPIYWENAEHKRISGSELNANYYGYSFGGARQDKNMLKTYMNYANYYGNNKNIWQPVSKANWQPQRARI